MTQEQEKQSNGPLSIIFLLVFLVGAIVFSSWANVQDMRCRNRADEILASINETTERVLIRIEEYKVVVKIVYKGTAGKWETQFPPLKGCFFNRNRLTSKGLIKADRLDDEGREVWIRAPADSRQTTESAMPLHSAPYTD